MAKVLIRQNEISAYNVSTYNCISELHELTVAYYSKDKTSIPCSFQKHKLNYIKIKSIILVSDLKSLCKQFDVVIFVPDFHVPAYCLLPFGNRRYKVISWSIGFRVSYVHPYITYRKHNLLDRFFQKVLSVCDANIFYINKSREFWKNTNLRMDNIFEAINTTDVEKIEFNPELKKDFLFIGTLYKGKGLDLLLEAYNKFYKQSSCNTKLRIVGAGSEREVLEQYVKDNGLQDNVAFHGAIYDEKEILKIFQQSLLCFSPTQAGLSVPKSMGYGVPFVSRKDAITGGEIYHIQNGVNGIMYEKDEDLSAIMLDAFENRIKYIDMGRRAMDYYYSKATNEIKAEGVIDAINYVIS